MYLDLVTAEKSVDILKRVPTTAIYAEQTSLLVCADQHVSCSQTSRGELSQADTWLHVVQLRGLTGQHASLLPFDGRKQNLMLKVLDSLGFHSRAGISRFNLTRIRSACKFRPGAGHTGRP